jgi:hypothetical protein
VKAAAELEGIAVRPAIADRLGDVVAVLGCDPSSPCCCQYWRMSSGEYARSSLEARRDALLAQTRETPPPGMVAYVDDEPAGWCGFGVRQRMERLVRSRTIPAVDDLPVWAIFCFTVRTGYRRRGVCARAARRADRLRTRPRSAGTRGLPRRHARRANPWDSGVRRHDGHVRGRRLPSRARDERAERAAATLADAPRPPQVAGTPGGAREAPDLRAKPPP